jgi:hypothetical protein
MVGPALMWRSNFMQLKRAISQVKKQLIRDHVDHCLETAASRQVGEVSGVVD